MQAIEDYFDDAEAYQLITGHRSDKALHIYRKLGYRETRREPKTETITLVHMEKGNTRDPV